MSSQSFTAPLPIPLRSLRGTYHLPDPDQLNTTLVLRANLARTNYFSQLLIWRHQLISHNLRRKLLLAERRRMSPGLQSVLLVNRLHETTTPFQPWKRRRHSLNGVLVYQSRIGSGIICSLS